MSTTKVAVTIDEKILLKIDGFVKCKMYKNRSRAVQSALISEIARIEQSRLARECVKLNPEYEKQMADEGMEFEKWPEY